MSSKTKAVFLRDLIEVNPKVKMQKGQSYPFVDMAAVKEWQRDVSMADIKPREFKGSGSKFEVGDILLARITPCFENGKTAIAPSIQGPGHGSTEFIVIRPKDPRDHAFVYGLLRSPEFRSYAIGQMVGTSGRQRIPNEAVLNFAVELPEECYRHKAAQLLGGIDDVCSVLRNQNTVLEAIAQRLFRSWFVNFDPVHAKAAGKEPEAMSAELAALFPSEFEDSELGPIPKGWSVTTFGECLSHTIGGDWGKDAPDEKHTQSVRVIRGTDIPDLLSSNSSTVPRRFVQPSKFLQRSLQPYDLVIEVSGGSKDQSTGRALMVTRSMLSELGTPSVPASFCRLFRPSTASLGVFLGRRLKWHYDEGHMWGYQVQSTGIANFQTQFFLSTDKMAVPPEALLAKFKEIVGPMLESSCNPVIRALAELRDHLLPRLISGKLSLEEAVQAVEEATAA